MPILGGLSLFRGALCVIHTRALGFDRLHHQIKAQSVLSWPLDLVGAITTFLYSSLSHTHQEIYKVIPRSSKNWDWGRGLVRNYLGFMARLLYLRCCHHHSRGRHVGSPAEYNSRIVAVG